MSQISDWLTHEMPTSVALFQLGTNIAITALAGVGGWIMRGVREKTRHHHDWTRWKLVEVTRTIPPIINKGQGSVVIEGHMQHRECQSCGETQTRDLS